LSLCVFVATLGPVFAQTNAPAPKIPDPELFFTAYREAVRLVNERKLPDAARALEALTKKLAGSPWLDVAVLKYAELIETSHEEVALQQYRMLAQRLQNAPYFQGDSERAKLFRHAISGAIESAINRVRTKRVRTALDKYFARHAEYPESLMKLSILNYVELEDTMDASGKPFRYIPGGMQLAPFISYKRYEGLEFKPPEPLVVALPKLDGTSLIEETPPKYAALLSVPRRMDPLRIVENQTLDGYLVIAIAEGGAVLSNNNRVLVLLTPR